MATGEGQARWVGREGSGVTTPYEPDAYMTEEAAKCRLSVVHQVPGVTVYRLGLPDTGLGSTKIIIISAPLQEQIILAGDLHPGDGHGLVSAPGYGLEWWSKPKGAEYLCEKFGLPQVYVREYAIQSLRSDMEREEMNLESDPDDDTVKRVSDIKAAIRAVEDADNGVWGHDEDPTRSAEAFYDWHIDTFGTSPDGEGWGYSPRDTGWLVAIQHRFAECWREMGR